MSVACQAPCASRTADTTWNVVLASMYPFGGLHFGSPGPPMPPVVA